VVGDAKLARFAQVYDLREIQARSEAIKNIESDVLQLRDMAQVGRGVAVVGLASARNSLFLADDSLRRI
jgi:hypothetical protein